MRKNCVLRGHIEFEQHTDQSFVDLVDETLQQSEHIDTQRDRIPQRDTEVLRLEEVTQGNVQVTFYPQVWDDGTTVTSDDPISFVVPEDDATDGDGNLFAHGSRGADSLKHHRNAPPGVQHFPGPYDITLQRIDE